MTTSTNSEILQRQTDKALQALGIPVHGNGYKQLRIAIPYYFEHSTGSFTKDLYPYVAQQFGYVDCRSVERSMRYAIRTAWKQHRGGDWEVLFPAMTRSPSNSQFIATIAEQLR